MEYRQRIKAIRDRAARIGVPLRDVLQVARVNPSTLFRWEQDDANPRMRTMFRALDAMEADLRMREQRIVSEISREGRAA